MVHAVSSKSSEPIQLARPENVGQFNRRQIVVLSGNRQVSNFVAGGNDDLRKYDRMFKVSCVIALVLSPIALAHGDTVLAGALLTGGGLLAGYSFIERFMSA